MKTVIAIFFFVMAVALVVLPWRTEHGGRVGWRTRIGLAVLLTLAGIGALVAEDPFD